MTIYAGMKVAPLQRKKCVIHVITSFFEQIIELNIKEKVKVTNYCSVNQKLDRRWPREFEADNPFVQPMFFLACLFIV